MAQHVNDNNFEEIVLKNNMAVLVYFWAEWCGPCCAIGPVIEELSKEHEDKAEINKLNNTDDNPVTPSNYCIRGIPTLLVFKNSQVVIK